MPRSPTVEGGLVSAQKSIQLFEETKEAWIHVVPEANSFLRYCEHFLRMLRMNVLSEELLSQDLQEPDAREDTHQSSKSRSKGRNASPTRKEDRAKNWADQPIKYYQSQRVQRANSGDSSEWDEETAIIQEVVQRIVIGKKFLLRFLEADDRKETLQESIIWSAQRKDETRDIREYFRDETYAICSRLHDLVLYKSTQDQDIDFYLNSLLGDIPNNIFKFWGRFIDRRASADIHQFIDKYTVLYGKLDTDDKRYIEKSLGPVVTVFGLINFANKHGFPFGKNIAPTTRASQCAKPDENRPEMVRMAMDLMTEFSSQEMQKHITTVKLCYNGCTTQTDNDFVARGLLTMFLTQGKSHEQACRFIEAKEALSFFYQRFMAVWRFDTVARNAFDSLQFPGEGRARDFMYYVGKFDFEAYIHEKPTRSNCGPEEQWKRWVRQRPEVQSFMDAYLTLV